MYLKKVILPYKHTLQWFIGIINNNNRLPPASVFTEHRDGKQTIY